MFFARFGFIEADWQALADALPCVLLFGPTDPAVWAPPGDLVTVVRAPTGSLAAIEPATVKAEALAGLRLRPWISAAQVTRGGGGER